jgi:N-acetylglucosamine-6-phosphate deacetylase
MRLRSGRIVTPLGTVAGEVIVEAGRIQAILPASADAAAIDLGSRWLAPGLIDGHVHGGAGANCNTADPEEIAQVARFHARHGTTALMATTVAAGTDELCAALAAIDRCRGVLDGAEVLGAHLEGPFLSRARPGAMDPDTFLDPDARVLERLMKASCCLRLMTVAPELPGALELIEQLVGLGVVVSLGHSEADYEQAGRAVTAGASSATHVFNAMAPFHHRRPGLVGAVLDLPGVNCELICDGVHVAPAAMRLARRAKGTHGLRLVTDAMRAAGMPDGEYRLGGAPVRVTGGRPLLVEGGSLAASTLTMDRALAGAVEMLGLSVEEAVELAAANPARVLGLENRKGAIAPGLDADLVVLDEGLGCWATMVGGRWVHGPLSETG